MQKQKFASVYVWNTRNHKLHSIYCDSLPYEENKIYFSTIDEANAAGYTDQHYECMGDWKGDISDETN